jgi:hypothetical protein
MPALSSAHMTWLHLSAYMGLVGDGTTTKGESFRHPGWSVTEHRPKENREYAIPNYLTNRLVNVRLVTKF